MITADLYTHVHVDVSRQAAQLIADLLDEPEGVPSRFLAETASRTSRLLEARVLALAGPVLLG